MSNCKVLFYGNGNLKGWDCKRPEVTCGFMFWEDKQLIVLTPRGDEDKSSKLVNEKFNLRGAYPTALGVMTPSETRVVSFAGEAINLRDIGALNDAILEDLSFT